MQGVIPKKPNVHHPMESLQSITEDFKVKQPERQLQRNESLEQSGSSFSLLPTSSLQRLTSHLLIR